MASTPEQHLLPRIFHPVAFAKVDKAREKGTRFVHYTDAAAALSILEIGKCGCETQPA